jgi:hypothetical protein
VTSQPDASRSSAGRRRRKTAARNPTLDDIEEMQVERSNTSATWGSQQDEQSVLQPNDTSDDSDDNESGSFTVKQGRGAKKRQRIATSSPVNSPAAHSAASTVKQGRGGAPPAHRVSPLVLEGLSDAERSNDMHIASLLAAGQALIKRTQRTKSGTVLVLPRSLDTRGQLLQLKLREA